MLNKRKSGPGRPKKVFIPKPKVKHDKPGRPKKEIKPYMQSGRKGLRWFVSSNILHAPKKDNIILLLFVLSLLIFLSSIYITILKSQKALGKQLVAENPVVNVDTGNIPFAEWETQIVTGSETAPQVPTDVQAVITAFYDAVNQKNMSTLYTLADVHLKATNMFKTYFSNNRLSKVLWVLQWNILVQNISISARPTTSTTVQEVHYTLVYPLRNGEQKSEEWSALVLLKGTAYKIGKLMCITTGCSKMTFFNPEKTWIK